MVEGFSVLADIPELTANDVNELRRELMVVSLVTDPKKWATRMSQLAEWALADLAKRGPEYTAPVVIPPKKKQRVGPKPKGKAKSKSGKASPEASAPAESRVAEVASPQSVPAAAPAESKGDAPAGDGATQVRSDESSVDEKERVNVDEQADEEDGSEAEQRRTGPLGLSERDIAVAVQGGSDLQKHMEGALKAAEPANS